MVVERVKGVMGNLIHGPFLCQNHACPRLYLSVRHSAIRVLEHGAKTTRETTRDSLQSEGCTKQDVELANGMTGRSQGKLSIVSDGEVAPYRRVDEHGRKTCVTDVLLV